jgi:hypothetical protein
MWAISQLHTLAGRSGEKIGCSQLQGVGQPKLGLCLRLEHIQTEALHEGHYPCEFHCPCRESVKCYWPISPFYICASYYRPLLLLCYKLHCIAKFIKVTIIIELPTWYPERQIQGGPMKYSQTSASENPSQFNCSPQSEVPLAAGTYPSGSDSRCNSRKSTLCHPC